MDIPSIKVLVDLSAQIDIIRLPGSLIQVDLLSVHFNAQLWGPLPVDQFHPERHLVKRHPLAFMPFGGGPRLCLGMRFGLRKNTCLSLSSYIDVSF